MNRRDFLFRTAGALALAAIPAPLRAFSGLETPPKPIPSPLGEKVDYRLTDRVFLDQLHQDFPEYAFWMTPLLHDPMDFVVRRGILVSGPATVGRTCKLKVAVTHEAMQDMQTMRGYRVDDELYNMIRYEIALELTARQYERLVLNGKWNEAIHGDPYEILHAQTFTFPHHTPIYAEPKVVA